MEKEEHYVAHWISGNKARDAVPDILLVILLVTLIAISIKSQLGNPQGNWFMRSGAVMVLVGVILEYRHGGLMRKLDTTSIKWANGIGGSVIFEPHPLRKIISYLARLFVILGTFIAAYGDLVFQLCNELPSIFPD